VLKTHDKSYIFSVVFVINLNIKKVFLFFKNRWNSPEIGVTKEKR